jgi:glycosyltransferase involved in cell wall biosynthesis
MGRLRTTALTERRRVRIAWVVYGDLLQATGGYVYDRLLVAALRKAGDSVDVVSLTANRRLETLRLLAQLSALGPDVVVADELCFREAAGVFALAQMLPGAVLGRSKRVLLLHHLSEWEDGVARFGEWLCLRCADRVIVSSETSGRRLWQEYGVSARVCVPGADRLPLVPRRGVSREPLAERSTAASGSLVELLFVGTWTRRKGLGFLIAGLAPLGPASYRLTIIGDMARDPAYAASVHTALLQYPDVAQRTRVLGVLDDAALAVAYAGADVLVLPSLFEGYGMVLSEAVSAGLAVIATRVGAIPEVVRDGAEAILVPAADVPALSQALRTVVSDTTARERMQHQARARSYPSWRETAARFRAALT